MVDHDELTIACNVLLNDLLQVVGSSYGVDKPNRYCYSSAYLPHIAADVQREGFMMDACYATPGSVTDPLTTSESLIPMVLVQSRLVGAMTREASDAIVSTMVLLKLRIEGRGFQARLVGDTRDSRPILYVARVTNSSTPAGV